MRDAGASVEAGSYRWNAPDQAEGRRASPAVCCGRCELTCISSDMGAGQNSGASSPGAGHEHFRNIPVKAGKAKKHEASRLFSSTMFRTVRLKAATGNGDRTGWWRPWRHAGARLRMTVVVSPAWPQLSLSTSSMAMWVSSGDFPRTRCRVSVIRR